MNDRQKRKVEERRRQCCCGEGGYLPGNKKIGNYSTKDLAVGGGVDFNGRRERFHLPVCS